MFGGAGLGSLYVETQCTMANDHMAPFPPRTEWLIDRHELKHYLPATSLANGNKQLIYDKYHNFLLFQEGEFPGFVPLIKEYLNDIDDVDIDTSCTILQYLNFISKRASGKLEVKFEIIWQDKLEKYTHGVTNSLYFTRDVMAYFHTWTRIHTRTWIPVLCRFFHWFRIRLRSPDWNICNRDTDLSLEQRSIPKMGTVPIWERDPNLNLSQW